MEYLGEIVHLQIQTASPKRGDRPRRWYDPEPIQAVAALTIEPAGASHDGALDVHHEAHPAGKNVGDNAISLGFTGHYGRMRAYFGAHLEEGVAGENILIRCERQVGEEDLGHGVTVVTAAGEEATLHAIRAAEPCVEFTRYALRYPQDVPSDGPVTEALRFLRAGMRGFYASYAGSPVVLQSGDRVYLG